MQGKDVYVNGVPVVLCSLSSFRIEQDIRKLVTVNWTLEGLLIRPLQPGPFSYLSRSEAIWDTEKYSNKIVGETCAKS